VNYWYSADANEMFLDLDSTRALRRAVSVLLVAVKRKRLPVERMFLYRTKQRGHYHMILVFSRSVSDATKFAWSLWMGNDRLRMAYVLARQDDERIPKFRSGDLLVSTRTYYRRADSWCQCTKKHKPDAVTKRCPAMAFLLGKARSADYFARTGERRVKPLRVRVPWGEVKVSEMKRWLKRK